MVIGEEEIINLLIEIGKIGYWLQAIGLMVILWIVFQIVSLIINKKNRNTLKYLRLDIKRLETKVDKLSKR
ncbi:MAG: hypothetical protein Q8L29_00660 [archaeon]|nr:hypothetical protein [archaeon]